MGPSECGGGEEFGQKDEATGRVFYPDLCNAANRPVVFLGPEEEPQWRTSLGRLVCSEDCQVGLQFAT